eukprot:4726503-Pyramimonas_sp.AAC.1
MNSEKPGSLARVVASLLRRFARAANCPNCPRKPAGGPARKNSTRGARMSRRSSWRVAPESSA